VRTKLDKKATAPPPHRTTIGGATNGISPQLNVGFCHSSISSCVLDDDADFSSGSAPYGSAETGAEEGGAGLAVPNGVETAAPNAPKPLLLLRWERERRLH
jgi:hypothetical protein